MNLAGVDLNLLVALDLLLEARSVRGAARRAGLSPSAMSHTLARLRALLGDDLLVRAGAALVRTPRAEALRAPLKGLLEDAAALLAAPDAFAPDTLRRAFRLVCTDHVTAVLLPGLEALLRAEAPGVDLYVGPLLPATTDQLRTGEIDAAIGLFPEAPPELRARRLFHDHFVTVARRDHPRLGPGPLSLEAFLAEDHLLVSPRGTPTGTVDALLAARGLRRRVARTLPHFLAALWHVAETDLLLSISARLVAATAGRLPLQVFQTPLPVEDYPMNLVWHPRLDRAPEHRWLRGRIVAAAEGLPGLGEEGAARAP